MGGTGGTSPLRSSRQLLAHHMPVSKDVSPSLLGTLWPGWLPLRTPLPRGGFCSMEVPTGFAGSWERRAPRAACTALPAPKGTLLTAQPHVSGCGKRDFHGRCVSSPPQGSDLPTTEGLWHCRHTQAHVGKVVDKVISGLDWKYTDTENTQNGEENAQNKSKWRRKCLSQSFLYLPNRGE